MHVGALHCTLVISIMDAVVPCACKAPDYAKKWGFSAIWSHIEPDLGVKHAFAPWYVSGQTPTAVEFGWVVFSYF